MSPTAPVPASSSLGKCQMSHNNIDTFKAVQGVSTFNFEKLNNWESVCGKCFSLCLNPYKTKKEICIPSVRAEEVIVTWDIYFLFNSEIGAVEIKYFMMWCLEILFSFNISSPSFWYFPKFHQQWCRHAGQEGNCRRDVKQHFQVTRFNSCSGIRNNQYEVIKWLNWFLPVQIKLIEIYELFQYL